LIKFKISLRQENSMLKIAKIKEKVLKLIIWATSVELWDFWRLIDTSVLEVNFLSVLNLHVSKLEYKITVSWEYRHPTIRCILGFGRRGNLQDR
jgi:hypothetical protein